MTTGEQTDIKKKLRTIFNNLIIDMDTLEQEIFDSMGKHHPDFLKAIESHKHLETALNEIELAMDKLT